MRTDIFEAELEPEEDGRWSAWLASYPACAAWGDTREEALQALADMTVVFLGVMQDSGEPVHADNVGTQDAFGQAAVGMVNPNSMASVVGDTIRIPIPV